LFELLSKIYLIAYGRFGCKIIVDLDRVNHILQGDFETIDEANYLDVFIVGVKSRISNAQTSRFIA